MLKNKAVLSVGVTLLFILISLSPVTAQLFQNDIIESLVFGEDETEFEGISEEQLLEFMENLEGVSSYSGALLKITELLGKSNEGSPFQELLSEIAKISPFKKRALIVSFGSSPTLNPLRTNQVNVLRPSTFLWYYSGTSGKILSDKTIIIDPNPFHVRMIDGRQIGLVRRFVGAYSYQPGAILEPGKTLFIGYASRAIGIDLSPLESTRIQ